MLFAFCSVLVWPYAELTSDDGSQLLDAWMRLQEGDWFSLHVRSSQGPRFSPLASWLLAAALSVRPSVTAVQALVLGLNLIALVLVRQVARKLRLRLEGLLTGFLILLLPALSLNYTGKLCNPGFILPASAWVLWARFCRRGRSRWIHLALSLFFALQIHFSFVIHAAWFLLERFMPRLKVRIPGPFALVPALLLLAACLGAPGLPLLKNLVDLIAPGSGYMAARSAPIGGFLENSWFIPVGILPLFAQLSSGPALLAARPSARRALWLHLSFSILALAASPLVLEGSAHQWVLAWVIPALLLLEMGLERLSRSSIRRAAALTVLLLVMATRDYVGAFALIALSGGTGWHGPNLEARRDILSFIAQKRPGDSIVLAGPPAEANASLSGWLALATLPGEFGGKLRLQPGTGRTVVIREMGSLGWSPECDSVKMAMLHSSGATSVYQAQGPLDPTWPAIGQVKARPRKSE
ncbi:MAG TPA: hypothetical protein VM598_00090 [Bdellovibrionota bacterium]|nr:hypothetical protein [Bdellovibrionota bacterium]